MAREALEHIQDCESGSFNLRLGERGGQDREHALTARASPSQLRFSVQSVGDPTRVKLPALLIQPLAENSIRHAIAPRIGPGWLSVRVAVTDERCNIVVEDDGRARTSAERGHRRAVREWVQRMA